MPESKWKPIETAPGDGTWILGTTKRESGKYSNPVSVSFKGNWAGLAGNVMRPTYWMPLPDAPDGGEYA